MYHDCARPPFFKKYFDPYIFYLYDFVVFLPFYSQIYAKTTLFIHITPIFHIQHFF